MRSMTWSKDGGGPVRAGALVPVVLVGAADGGGASGDDVLGGGAGAGAVFGAGVAWAGVVAAGVFAF